MISLGFSGRFDTLLPLFLIFFLLSCFPGFSQNVESPAPPERLEVQDYYEERDPRSVPVPITIITQEEIRAGGARNAAEVVAMAPGVTLNRYGGRSQATLVSLRGFSSDQVLILMNGKKLNTAQGGGVDLSLIPSENLIRVEILRGGVGALYGSGAMGGVINLVTADEDNDQENLEAYYGLSSENTHEAGVIYGKNWDSQGNFSTTLGLHGLYSRGDYTFYSPNYETILTRENAQVLLGGGNLNAQWKPFRNNATQFGFSLSHQSSQRGVPGMESFTTPRANLEDHFSQGVLDLEIPWDGINNLTSSAVLSRQFRKYKKDTLLETMDSHENTGFEGNLIYHRVSKSSLWTGLAEIALNGTYQKLDSTALVLGGGSEGQGLAFRQGFSVLALGTWSFFPWKDSPYFILDLSPALRYNGTWTEFPQEGSNTRQDQISWNMGLLLTPTSTRTLVFKGNLGTSYHLPSFDDLFWLDSGFALGNPSLKPELGWNLDLGVVFQPLDWLKLEGGYYRQDVVDLIHWNPGAGGVWRPRNLGSALMTGGETELQIFFDLEKISLYWETRLNYTYLLALNQEPIPANHDKQLPYTPGHQGTFSTTFTQYDGYVFNISGSYTGYRYTTEANTVFLPSYFLLDTTLTLPVFEKWEVSLFVKNILGTPYISRQFYPVPGLEAGLKIRMKFHEN